MLSAIAAFILRLWGWKITGSYPHQLSKMVVAVAPHTSNWDFPVGVLVNTAWRLRANFVAKHSLFRWPFGGLFRFLGGIPVNRSRSTHFVAATVEAFRTNPRLHLVIAPEGQRARVDRFKSGFYHIARMAEVPICLCTFDWGRRVVHFDPELFYFTADEAGDLARIWDYYRGVKGANPGQGIY